MIDELIKCIYPNCLLDEHVTSSAGFLIDYFVPSPPTFKSPHHSNEDLSDVTIDRKANKHFEPPPSATSAEQTTKPVPTNEHLLCTIPCANESSFISIMQQSNKKISQANLSPAIFLQRTTTSSFSALYTFDPISSSVRVTLKYTNPPAHISLDQNSITLNELIELISQRLEEEEVSTLKIESVQTNRRDVNDLRGSLPVPLTISQLMLLVKPNSTDKQNALKCENLVDNTPNQIEQWFDTSKNQYEMFECSICCEALTSDDVYQLLPCTFKMNFHRSNHFLCLSI